MTTWQVQQAKTHFSEVIERAQSEGPQTITKHGKPRAVVLSATEYEALSNGKAKPKKSFVEFLLSSGPNSGRCRPRARQERYGTRDRS